MTDPRSQVAALASRPDHAKLLRPHAVDSLTAPRPASVVAAKPAPARPQAEPADRRVGLCLTARQETALKAKAGDVPLARWITRHLERQGIIPVATSRQKS